MNKIYKFKSISEATSHIGAVSPNVSYVVGSTNKVVYANFGNNKKIRFVNNNGVVTAEEATGLRFTAQQANSTVKLKKNGTLNTSYEYSTDNENWSSYTIGDVITLANIGDKVYFRGDNSRVTFSSSNYMSFNMTGVIAVGGNIMSILDKTMELNSVPAYSFYRLFWFCKSLTTAPQLPATTLSVDCYARMFEYCSSLTTAPQLPATTLAGSCYESMFADCTSLTSAPELPATSLANYCYQEMFNGCTSLTTAPTLPATTTIYRCYKDMFKNCTLLTSLSIYANTIYDSDVSGWLDNVYPNGTLYSYGSADFNGNIPNTWNIVVKSPLCFTAKLSNSVIKLKTVGTLSSLSFEYSYDKNNWNNYSLGNTITLSNNSTVYFRGDNTSATGFDQNNHLLFEMSGSIQSAGNIMSLFDSTLETDTIGEGYCISLFEDCTVLTKAPQLPATTLSQYCYYKMFSGCTSLTTTPVLSAKTLKTMCYYGMFQDCTSLTSASAVNARTLAPLCCVSMFNGCTNLIDAPTLYAANTTNSCYGQMFENCYSLTELYVCTLDISAELCLYEWLKNTAQNTTGVLHVIGTTDFSGSVPENWSIKNEMLLNFTANEANSTVKLKKNGTLNNSYEYSTDNINWDNYTIGNVITLENVGDKVYFRGDNNRVTFGQSNYMSFEMTGSISGRGNIMSLLDSAMKTNTCTVYCFNKMFYNCTSLTTAPELPSTTLAYHCYDSMFQGCTSLTTAPQLPATTLVEYCYPHMFSNCTSLTTAPELPATTLAHAYYCYNYMFSGCTSLTTAPELSATTLESYCYEGMFADCTSLIAPPQLPATTLTSYCYKYMFLGCTSLITAPQLPATTLASNCYYGMFQGCTSLITAPQLPATTLANDCYYNMFSLCTSLKTAPEMSATTLARSCCGYMFPNCTSLKTAPDLLATTLAERCYSGMFYGCTSLTSLTVYADDISASRCVTDWLYGINTTGTLYSLGSADFTGKVPSNWTISTTPPA